MPRFVILEHDHPALHLDFMLEAEGALRTWRLAATALGAGCIVATPLGDHRLAYLDYEGPVSGGRGTVRRWDQGEYEEVFKTEQCIVVKLWGQRLRGAAKLERNTGDWTLHWAAE
jgi:DNA polymerase Ligase (LigD)